MSIQNHLDELVASGQEIGVQVAAYVDGQLVVNAAAGVTDLDTRTPVDTRTLFPSHSAGKGAAAIVVATLVDRGVLDYDDPVAKFWPEYAANGKGSTTLGHVLSHQAGVPYLPADITAEQLVDVRSVAAWLAGQTPEWEPGTATGYHGWTYGHLTAEIVQRAAGCSIEDVLRDVAASAGVSGELYFGLPADVPAATLYEGNWAAMLPGLPPNFHRVAPRLVLPVAELTNRELVRSACLPASGTVTAHGLATLYAKFMTGELTSPGVVERATRQRTAAPDQVFGAPIPKAYGFFLGNPFSDWGTRTTIYGMNGSGGSVGFADPERRFAFAFTHNRMVGGDQESFPALVKVIRAEYDL
ncbi:MAG: beta-lactamase family protein [Hamadaea sp.]|uniref:serine hydrolase domain-containing protein n=1 Tax=Hamadaea sp. TaxID=2024425 RepID=UPI001792B5A0|nr:serine hydrolase domain-containing protein [Hamadaea sp.]NUT18690.1 beta-lactamase family protein [Hamadaea sp.]